MDLGTKFWVHESTPYGRIQPVAGFFNLLNVRNTGAAFSFLANGSDWSRLFLLAIAVVPAVWLIWILRKPLPTWQRLAYSLILGGTLGNGVDRGVRGYVVDFLDFHWGNWHWPAFNIADIAIVCGRAGNHFDVRGIARFCILTRETNHASDRSDAQDAMVTADAVLAGRIARNIGESVLQRGHDT